MINIYAFIGVSGSGKDFTADKIISESVLKSFKFDFSDGVRDYTFSFLGYTPANKIEYEEFKEGKSTVYIGQLRFIKGREFLDNVGMKMREFDPSFWANYALNKAMETFYTEKEGNFIFGSCRFPNEAQTCFDLQKKIQECGVVCDIKFIFCDYESEKYDLRPLPYQEFALHFKTIGCKDGKDITNEVREFLWG